jgi:hypothetical protein
MLAVVGAIVLAGWPVRTWPDSLAPLLPFDLRQAVVDPTQAMSCWPWRTPLP